MALLTQPRGLYYEDFQIGDSIESGRRTITEADIVNFAGLSGDFYELHTDEEYARNTIFGTRIAHGMLVLSIATGLMMQLGFLKGTVEAFRGVEWQFRRPVFIGDTVRVRAEVEAKKVARRLGGGIVTLRVAVLNQKDEVVQRGTWSVLVRSRPEA